MIRSLVKRSGDIYKKEGILTLLQRSYRFVRANSLVPVFAVLDRLTDVDDQKIVIVLRRSTIDSDTFALIESIQAEDMGYEINIIVESMREYDSKSEINLRDSFPEVNVLESGSAKYIRNLAECKYLFCKNEKSIKIYRYVADLENKITIRLYHGIITKSYGNLKNSSQRLDYINRKEDSFDLYPVASEVEKFFRSSAEGRHPSLFKEIGHPRFDRIFKIKKERGSPVLPESSKEKIKNDDSKKILYAPTHKDTNTTNLFPFQEFSQKDFRMFLNRIGATMYIRMHPNEEDLGFYDEYIDGENIRYAGQNFSNSSTEILTYFDLLITDYSSIYIDYLPFDRPIVFVNDSSFSSNRGIAYDYNKYFPGPKPQEYKDFKNSIVNSINNDSYTREREFVRKVFGVDSAPDFTSRLFENN